MEWIEVLQRIQNGEDETTELGRFQKLTEKDWLETACAFANSQGGVIILGVTDDGRIDGVPMDSESVQEHLTNCLQSSFNMPMRARTGLHQDPKGWVHWVEVRRMREGQPLTYKGRVYVRRQRSSVAPGASELAELYNTFGLILTEERVVPSTSASDIDWAAYQDWMRLRGVDLTLSEALPVEEELTRAEILGDHDNGKRGATLYGLLCFGRSPQSVLAARNMSIYMAAYAGQSRGDDLKLAGEATGRLDEQVLRCEEWLRHLGWQEQYHGSRREDRWIVPQRALREALVNAVAHRDYTISGSRVQVDVFDDRVEITSPGALPNHKTAESLLSGGPPRSRNEAMANYLLVRGLMEQRGTGWLRIRKTMRQFNGTEPGLEHQPVERWLRVTLLRGPRDA